MGTYLGWAKIRFGDVEAPAYVDLTSRINFSNLEEWGGALETNADLWEQRGKIIEIVLPEGHVGKVLIGGGNLQQGSPVHVKGSGRAPF